MKGHSTDGCLWLGGGINTVGGSGARNLARVCEAGGPGPTAGPQLQSPTNPPGGDPFIAPAACSAGVSGRNVQISWSAVTGATDYIVYRNEFWTGRSGGATTFLDKSVPTNRTHSYSVKAENASAQRTDATLCDPSVIDLNAVNQMAPASCTATYDPAAPGDVVVTWASVADADRYVVFRNAGTNDFWAGAVDAPATTFTNTSVPTNTALLYKVEARSAAGVKSARTVCADVDVDPVIVPFNYTAPDFVFPNNGPDTRTQTIDLSALGAVIGQTGTLNQVLARGDMNGFGENFDVKLDNGWILDLTTGTANTNFEPALQQLGQQITIVDIGGGMPGIVVTVAIGQQINIGQGGNTDALQVRMSFSFA